jgi:hypothetical protein
MNELLKALADHDREREAPAAVEARLRSAFRTRYARPKWPYFAFAAVAAGIALFMSIPRPQTMPIVVPAPAAASLPPTPPVVKPLIRRRQQPREVVTQFFPLMEDAPPFERGELLRVSLPASVLRSMGVSVSEERLTDRVEADVLVGEEGLARAIRFVNTSDHRP